MSLLASLNLICLTPFSFFSFIAAIHTPECGLKLLWLSLLNTNLSGCRVSANDCVVLHAANFDINPPSPTTTYVRIPAVSSTPLNAHLSGCRVCASDCVALHAANCDIAPPPTHVRELAVSVNRDPLNARVSGCASSVTVSSTIDMVATPPPMRS